MVHILKQWQHQLWKIWKKWGELDIIFQLKGTSNKFLSFFFDNFCQLLGFWGDKSPQSPHGVSTVLKNYILWAKIDPCSTLNLQSKKALTSTLSLLLITIPYLWQKAFWIKCLSSPISKYPFSTTCLHHLAPLLKKFYKLTKVLASNVQCWNWMKRSFGFA